MKKYLVIFFVILCNSVHAQKGETAQLFADAKFFYSEAEYKEASALFLKLVTLKPDNANYNFLLGESYLNTPGMETKAIPYLEKAVKNTTFKYRTRAEETRAPYHAWFFLGNSYRIDNNLDKALDSYERFKELKDFEKKYNLRIVDDEIKACERAKIIQDAPLNLRITNIGSPVNTANSDYAPVLSADENVMVYMSSQKFYEAILYTVKTNGTWSNPVNITPQVGSDGDMFPTSLSADGKELYIVKKDKNDNSDIYLSTWDGTFWSKAEPLGENINSRSKESFASVSADGKKLYFISDRRGSVGGLDIFVSKRQSVGGWGPAENLGDAVNTEFDEESVYLSPDGKTLYFSSKGHFNMGGFDVFYAPVDKSGKVSKVLNIGYPVNTTGDDLNFFPMGDGRKGYISLFNEDKQDKDIFRVEILSMFAVPAREQ